MSSEQAREYLERGIQAAKAGNRDEARTFIQQSLRIDQDNDTAWLWLASLTDDVRARLLILQRVLVINPDNQMAIKAVEALGVDPQALRARAAPQPPRQETPPTPEPEPEADDAYNAPFTADDAYEPEAEAEDIRSTFYDEDTGDFDETDSWLDEVEDADDDDVFATTYDDETEQDDIYTLFAEDDEATADDLDEFDEDEDVEDVNALFDSYMEDAGTAPEPARPASPIARVPRQNRPMSDGSGIPLPDPETLDIVRETADALIQDYLAVNESRQRVPVTWTRKARRRAGENEVVMLRLQVGVAVMTVMAALIGLAVLVVSNSPEIQVVLFGASPTPRPPTSTPTNTPTSTPGFTPTPSPTRDFTNEPTLTPSPTIFPSITPGQIEITPRPTDLYLPEEPVRAVSIADELLNAGDLAALEGTAIPLLSIAQEQQGSTTFDPNPFYYQALAYAELGNYQAALDVLTEAERRLDPNAGFVNLDDSVRYRPLVDLGYAQVYLRQSQTGATADIRQTNLNLARERAQAALNGDQRMAQAYVILAQIARQRGDYAQAIDVLTDGQIIPDLLTDLNLVTQKGRTYLEQGDALLRNDNPDAARASYASASYEGFYAVYLNPYNETAHQLQIEAALARNDPGLAVIYSQGYLLFFPDRAEAFRQLGDARLQEGNTDLALEAYGLALEGEGGPDVIAQVLVSRAALFSQQQRYEPALADLNQAMELSPSLQTRAQRMYAAYNAGELAIAEEDATALLGSDIISDNEANLMLARIAINQAAPDDTEALNNALALLLSMGNNLPQDLIPLADEYRARAHLALGNLDDARSAINRALNAAETGTRHYLLGQIYEAQDERENAIAEYEWVLTWNQVFNYDFAEDAARGIQRIRQRTADEQATATATAITATAHVTETQEAIATATATAGVPLTATAEVFATQTAEAAIPLTQTAQAAAIATQAVIQITETAAAQETNVAGTATQAVIRETAVLETATQAAFNQILTATARAAATATPTPLPQSN